MVRESLGEGHKLFIYHTIPVKKITELQSHEPILHRAYKSNHISCVALCCIFPGEPIEDMLESLAASSNVKSTKSSPSDGKGKNRDHVTFEESVASKSRRYDIANASGLIIVLFEYVLKYLRNAHFSLCSRNKDNEYYTRPTPHQVWKSEQDSKFKFKNRQVRFQTCLLSFILFNNGHNLCIVRPNIFLKINGTTLLATSTQPTK